MRVNKKLIFAILLCQSAGIIGSLFTASAIPVWYARLVKPEFTPPHWLFGPVWLTLYTLMGISLYRMWTVQKKTKSSKQKHSITSSLHFFYVHLLLNAYWSIVFFGIKDVVSALVIIGVLWTMIAGLIVWFYRYDKLAGLLLVPYLFWVSLATYLNYEIWVLN